MITTDSQAIHGVCTSPDNRVPERDGGKDSIQLKMDALKLHLYGVELTAIMSNSMPQTILSTSSGTCLVDRSMGP
ncbi:Uncharacterized protein HZ326_5243 [Fusarium oxysporum f. sp. albedinis]|nr:Uncharacterized protein HZ326_5243 [Fusarium oxysporum f. sp. albedinis]